MSALKAYLETQMDLGRPCTIRFRTVEGAVSEVRAHVIGIETVSGREIMETDAGLHIGLDQVLQVNDQVAPDYC